MTDALTRYESYFSRAEKEYELPEGLLRAIAQTESGGNPRAVSDKGAIGLMQFLPSTGLDYGLTAGELYEEPKAIDAAGRYLRDLTSRLGDTDAAIRAYYAGETGYRRGGLAYRQSGGYLRQVYAAWNRPVPGAEQRGETERTEEMANAAKVEELKKLFTEYDASLGAWWPGNWPALIANAASSLTTGVVLTAVAAVAILIGIRNA